MTTKLNEQILYDLIIKGIKLTTTRKTDTSIINASAIYNCCPRGFILSQEYNMLLHSSNYSNLKDDELITFKLGFVIEDMIREALSEYLVDNHEMSLDLGNFTLVGHRDITINYNGERYILEVKSIDKDEYDRLGKFPLYKHEFQLKTYLYLSRKNRLGIKCGFLIYVSKGRRNPPIKIYKVVCNKSFIKEMDNFVEALMKKDKNNRLCKSENHASTIKCPALTLCFKEGDYVKSK